MESKSSLDVLKERLAKIMARTQATQAEAASQREEPSPSSNLLDPSTQPSPANNLTTLFQPDASRAEQTSQASQEDQSSLDLIGLGSHESSFRAKVPASAMREDAYDTQPDLLASLSQALNKDDGNAHSQHLPEASQMSVGDFPSFGNFSHMSASQLEAELPTTQSVSECQGSPSSLLPTATSGASNDALGTSARSASSTTTSHRDVRELSESLAYLGLGDDMKDLLSELPPLNPDSDFAMTQDYLDELAASSTASTAPDRAPAALAADSPLAVKGVALSPPTSNQSASRSPPASNQSASSKLASGLGSANASLAAQQLLQGLMDDTNDVTLASNAPVAVEDASSTSFKEVAPASPSSLHPTLMGRTEESYDGQATVVDESRRSNPSASLLSFERIEAELNEQSRGPSRPEESVPSLSLLLAESMDTTDHNSRNPTEQSLQLSHIQAPSTNSSTRQDDSLDLPSTSEPNNASIATSVNLTQLLEGTHHRSRLSTVLEETENSLKSSPAGSQAFRSQQANSSVGTMQNASSLHVSAFPSANASAQPTRVSLSSDSTQQSSSNTTGHTTYMTDDDAPDPSQLFAGMNNLSAAIFRNEPRMDTTATDVTPLLSERERERLQRVRESLLSAYPVTDGDSNADSTDRSLGQGQSVMGNSIRRNSAAKHVSFRDQLDAASSNASSQLSASQAASEPLAQAQARTALLDATSIQLDGTNPLPETKPEPVGQTMEESSFESLLLRSEEATRWLEMQQPPISSLSPHPINSTRQHPTNSTQQHTSTSADQLLASLSQPTGDWSAIAHSHNDTTMSPTSSSDATLLAMTDHSVDTSRTSQQRQQPQSLHSQPSQQHQGHSQSLRSEHTPPSSHRVSASAPATVAIAAPSSNQQRLPEHPNQSRAGESEANVVMEAILKAQERVPLAADNPMETSGVTRLSSQLGNSSDSTTPLNSLTASTSELGPTPLTFKQLPSQPSAGRRSDATNTSTRSQRQLDFDLDLIPPTPGYGYRNLPSARDPSRLAAETSTVKNSQLNSPGTPPTSGELSSLDSANQSRPSASRVRGVATQVHDVSIDAAARLQTGRPLDAGTLLQLADQERSVQRPTHKPMLVDESPLPSPRGEGFHESFAWQDPDYGSPSRHSDRRSQPSVSAQGKLVEVADSHDFGVLSAFALHHAPVQLLNVSDQWVRCTVTINPQQSVFCVEEQEVTVAPNTAVAINVQVDAASAGPQRGYLHVRADILSTKGQLLSAEHGGMTHRKTCALRCVIEEPVVDVTPRGSLDLGVAAPGVILQKPINIRAAGRARCSVDVRLQAEETSPFWLSLTSVDGSSPSPEERKRALRLDLTAHDADTSMLANAIVYVCYMVELGVHLADDGSHSPPPFEGQLVVTLPEVSHSKHQVLEQIHVWATCSLPRLQVPRVMHAIVMEANPNHTVQRAVPIRNPSLVPITVLASIVADDMTGTDGPSPASRCFQVSPPRLELPPNGETELIVHYHARSNLKVAPARLLLRLAQGSMAYRASLRGYCSIDDLDPEASSPRLQAALESQDRPQAQPQVQPQAQPQAALPHFEAHGNGLNSPPQPRSDERKNSHEYPPKPISILSDTALVHFGAVERGNVQVATVAFRSNTGGGPVELEVRLSKDAHGSFSIVQADGMSAAGPDTYRVRLEPTMHLPIDITFHPQLKEVYRSNLTIRARYIGSEKYTHRFSVPLVGIGETCQVQLMAAQVDLSQAPQAVSSRLLSLQDAEAHAQFAHDGVSMVLQVDQMPPSGGIPIDVVLRNTGRRAAYVLAVGEDSEGTPMQRSQARITPEAMVIGPARRRSLTFNLQTTRRGASDEALLGSLCLYYGTEVSRSRYRRHLARHRPSVEHDAPSVRSKQARFDRYFAGEEKHVDRELPGRVHNNEFEFDEQAFVSGMTCIRVAVVVSRRPRTGPKQPSSSHSHASRDQRTLSRVVKESRANREVKESPKTSPRRVPKALRLDIPFGNGSATVSPPARFKTAKAKPQTPKQQVVRKKKSKVSPARSDATVVLQAWNAFPTQIQIPSGDKSAEFIISNTSEDALEFSTTYSNRGLALSPATGVLPPKSRLAVRVQPQAGHWPRQEQIFVLCNGQQEVVSLQLGSIDDEVGSSPRLPVSDKSSPTTPMSASSGFVWTPAVKVQQDSFQVSPELLRFDQVPIGQAQEQTFTIKNLTKRPITWVLSSVKGASLQKSPSGGVKRVGYPAFSPRRQSGTLAGYGEAQVDVTFVAREAGQVSQFWMVRSTHSQSKHMEMKTTIEMVGQGVEVKQDVPPPQPSSRKPLRALPSNLHFDDVVLGDTRSMHIKVCNEGEQEMPLYFAALGPSFLIRHSNVLLRPFSYVRLPVEFRPRSIGRHQGQLLITTAEGSELKIPLAATALSQ
eukprot:m.241961 g.241961  ORF g.241961 m.241961 type:complete len:2384 (-) comp17450_c0_seq2:48-7199(-)